MRVALVGTGSADGWPNPFCACDSCESERYDARLRQPSAALVDEVLLIDCGPTTPHGVEALGSRMRDVQHVLITHGHPDHLHPAFLLTREWVSTGHDLHVWAPAAALDLCRPWIGPDSPVLLHEVSAGDRLELDTRGGCYAVDVLPAAHSSGNGDVLADEAVLYLVESPDGNRLLYATDTAELPLATVARIDGSLDLVVLDETFGDTIDHGRGHLDLVTLPRMLDALRTQGAVTESTQVVVTHLSHHNPPTSVLAERLSHMGVRVVDDLTVLDTAATGAPTRHLVLGGARSGKSHYAESLAAPAGRVIYVATGGTRPNDREWVARVQVHRDRRPATWTTVETIDVSSVLAAAEPPTLVLVDCLALWLTGHLDVLGAWARLDDDRSGIVDEIASRTATLLDALTATRADVVLVSNEVGMGVVPETASGRLFQDLLGTINARIAAECDRTTLVVAGQPMSLRRTPRATRERP
jgi:adenosylcobinamide kinase/adenosylcobinamide-phosphate guanylyltransferase